MNFQARYVFVLLASVIGHVLSQHIDFGYCRNYPEYNTLYNLMSNDNCMNIDSVFKLLTDLTNREHSGGCRIHVIRRLSDHFGANARIPSNCYCEGVNRLQQYHTGSGDGVSDQRNYCLKNDPNYKNLYDQFFDSGQHHDIPACRTHHTLWSHLSQTLQHGLYGSNSCQKDIIFHLKYAFEQHTDRCSCSVSQYAHCKSNADYNTLIGLISEDQCMNIDLVFKLLHDVTNKVGYTCRVHVIELLSAHFGAHANTPDTCECHGANRLQPYHMGPGDGVNDYRDACLRNDNEYRALYYQFFEYNQHHDAPACRTHHSLWRTLKDVDVGSSCQKDLVFHLKYAFEKHPDRCSCSNNTGSHVTNVHNVNCHHLASFNKLLEIGDSGQCLSANSVWHYLDDIQVRSPECRERIQRHLAGKYKHATTKSSVGCVCNARKPLMDQEIHYLPHNGSLTPCSNSGGTYSTIIQDLFRNITNDGCQNHNYLWTKLEGINDHCRQHNGDSCTSFTDCTQDLLIRTSIQYPTDDSDPCFCSKVTTSMTPVTPAATTVKPVTTTQAPASATSAKVTQPPPTTTPKPPPPTTTLPVFQITKFSCDKFLAVEDIAKSLHETHPDSSPCDPNAHGSDDAYILSVCNMTLPSTWKRGANVMADCESSVHRIPTYTPISTFTNSAYTAAGAQPGIFLGCLGNGIKMAIQRCNGIPEIVHIESGAVNDNPRNYYVIV